MTVKKRHRALRILTGMVAMAVFAGALLWVLTRFAGGWGVPYFSFTTDNGSTCTNTLTGFVCNSITPADFALYSRQALPPGTVIVAGSMEITHNYTINAVLVTTKAQAANAAKVLTKEFGACGTGPTPAELAKATKICRMTTDDDVPDTDRPPPEKTYTVTTGLMNNGQRVTVLQIQSR